MASLVPNASDDNLSVSNTKTKAKFTLQEKLKTPRTYDYVKPLATSAQEKLRVKPKLY